MGHRVQETSEEIGLQHPGTHELAQLWRPLSRWLVDHRQPVILDVVFHVELETLPDEFVVDELCGKLPLIATYPSHVVSNDVWDVKVRPGASLVWH